MRAKDITTVGDIIHFTIMAAIGGIVAMAFIIIFSIMVIIGAIAGAGSITTGAIRGAIMPSVSADVTAKANAGGITITDRRVTRFY